jgi:hypothetical protein
MPFDPGRVDAWDWTGTDIRKESQGLGRETDSVQYRVIQELKRADPAYDIVVDDDASYEAADVIALRVDGEQLLIHLFHCKYAGGKPGQRVGDLYEVCGQAQRSVYWKEDPERLLDHLLRRDARRLRTHGNSRFEVGSVKTVRALKRRLRFLMPEMRVTVVQPGASRAELTTGQLDLLAATELYLRETYGVELGVVTSA